ncbi:transposase IS200 like protein [archaeon]|nr:transposase IS200 like protein [archaeon]
MTGSTAKDLRELLKLKAKQLDIEIEDMKVMPDYVHLFVKVNPAAAPHWIVQQLKAYTSHQLREKYSELKSRIPTLWTRSYYCERSYLRGHNQEVHRGEEGNTDIPKEITL